MNPGRYYWDPVMGMGRDNTKEEGGRRGKRKKEWSGENGK